MLRDDSDTTPKQSKEKPPYLLYTEWLYCVMCDKSHPNKHKITFMRRKLPSFRFL